MKKLLPVTPKPFKQAHPVRNLGAFAHPPSKTAHRTTKTPDPLSASRVPPDGDYKPKARQRQNKRHDKAKMQNQQSMDRSDNKSESKMSGMGPYNQAIPIFGKL